jgi:hypothetical protein
MADKSVTKLSADDAAIMVASAGVEFGADTDALFKAFKQESGGKEVTFTGDPKEMARKIAMSMTSSVPQAKVSVQGPSSSTTVSIGTKTKERGTAAQRDTFEQTAQGTEDTTQQLLSAFDTASGSTQSAIAAYGDAATTSGKANAVLAYTKAGAQVEQARQQEALLQSAGLNAGNPESMINQRIIDAEGLRSQRTILADQINSNNQIDALKDPFGWFMGQLKNELTIGRHNSLVRQENSAFQDIADRQKLVGSQLSISPAAMSENLRQIQLAQTAAVSMEADTIAAKAVVDAEREKTRDIVERMKLSGLPLDIQKQVLNNRLQEEDLRIKRLESSTRLSAYIEDRNSRIAARDAASAESTSEITVLNGARSLYGFEPLNDTTVKMLKPVERQLWIKLGSGQSIGDSPGEQIAAMKFMGIGPEQLTRVDQRKAQALIDIQAGAKEFLGSLQAKAGDFKDIAGSEAAKATLKSLKGGPETIVASVDGFLSKQREDFTSGSAAPNNIYKLRIGEMAMKAEFANNSVVKELLASGAKTLPAFGDGEVLAVMSNKANENLKSIPKLAKDLSDLYKSGLKTQFADKGYGTLGINLPDGYPAVVSGVSVNLMDQASVEQYLIRSVTRTLPLEGLFGPYSQEYINTPDGRRYRRGLKPETSN